MGQAIPRSADTLTRQFIKTAGVARPAADLLLDADYDAIMMIKVKHPKINCNGGQFSDNPNEMVQHQYVVTTGGSDTLESLVGSEAAQALLSKPNTSIWHQGDGIPLPSFISERNSFDSTAFGPGSRL